MISPGIIFVISVVASVTLLLIERLAGIGWDFHPDAETYINLSELVSSELLNGNLFGVVNNAYYLTVAALGSSTEIVITSNILIFALTNVIIFSKYKEFCKKYGMFSTINMLLFIIVILNPYRVHLSVHVLKDTVIILFFVIIAANYKYSWLAWIAIIQYRMVSLLYSLPLFKKNNIMIFGVLLLIVVALNPELLSRIYNASEVNMTFRDFDKVPNFYELGFQGSLIRAIVWPFFVLTGTFVLLSPTLLYIPLALGAFTIQLWTWMTFRKFGYSLGVYAAMGVFALMVTGFTSYIRYVFPLLIVLPILMMNAQIQRDKRKGVLK